MSTFSCQCQGYNGTLVVTEKEFYFTSSLFRVDLNWSNVKRMRLETQQIKGVPTSVLVVVLQQNEVMRRQSESPSVQSKRGSSSRKYFFYGFQDLLGAEEQIKRYMELYLATEKNDREEAREDSDKVAEVNGFSSAGSDVAKEESLATSRLLTRRKTETEVRRLPSGISFTGRRVPNSGLLRLKTPSGSFNNPTPGMPKSNAAKYMGLLSRVYWLSSVVLVAVMLVLLVRRHVFPGRPHPQHVFQTAEKFMTDIQRLEKAKSALELYDSHETLSQYFKQRKDLAEQSRVHTRQLEYVAMELMQHYVALQANIASLRGRRMLRQAQEQQSSTVSVPWPATISTEYSVSLENQRGQHVSSSHGCAHHPLKDNRGAPKFTNKRKSGVANKSKSNPAAERRRKMSISKLMGDVHWWARRAQSVWSYVATAGFVPLEARRPTVPSSARKIPHSTAGRGWVEYKERLGESFQVTQLVPAAEDEERHSCRILVKELLKTVGLTERVFAAFNQVFLLDRYREVASGEERASHWSQPPQTLGKLDGGHKYVSTKVFSGEGMVRVMMLRRLVNSLLYNEPLEKDQARRRAMSLWLADAALKFRQRELELLRGHTTSAGSNVTKLWLSFENEIMAPIATALRLKTSTDDVAVQLRNPLTELQFWYTGELAWNEHVLSFFSPEAQAEVRSTYPQYNQTDRSVANVNASPANLSWAQLPLFRGLLCFGGLPQLLESDSDRSQDGAVAVETVDIEGRSRREGGNIQEENSTNSEAESRDAAERVSTPANLSSEKTPVSAERIDLSSTTEVPAGHATAMKSEGQPRSTDSSIRVTFAPTGGDLWKELKLRWIADIQVFRMALGLSRASRSATALRSYRMDDESYSTVANAASVRHRLFGILSIVDEHYVRYLAPHSLRRLFVRLRQFLPSILSSRSEDVYIADLRSWGTQDPSVQLATTQVTGLASGTTSDVARSLLYLVVQPPPLLQISIISDRQISAAVVVFLLFVGVLVAIHMMHD